MILGDEVIRQDHGVVQGGGLSPQLYAMMLEVALKSNSFLKQLSREGRLLAYADDLFAVIRTPEEMESLFTAFSSLNDDNEWRMKFNPDKTQIMTKTGTFKMHNGVELDRIHGAQVVKTVKYLGFNLSWTKEDMVTFVKSKIFNHIRRLRTIAQA